MDVVVTDDAARVLDEAGAFLNSKPVQHNLVLTLLTERAAHPEPGRFLYATDGTDVVGVMFQSPLDFHAAITPMTATAVGAVVARAAEVAPDLPGVMGVAGTAARFAGAWAETMKTPAAPAEGQRLYELSSLRHPEGVPGQLRPAGAADEELVLGWYRGFEEDTESPVSPPEAIRRRIRSGVIGIWEDGEPVSTAGYTPAICGVSRVGLVYTPPEYRRQGYAAACTAAVSQVALDAGAERCILFTQLSNPQSNAIYRGLGYEPIEEQIRYHFGDEPG